MYWNRFLKKLKTLSAHMASLMGLVSGMPSVEIELAGVGVDEMILFHE
jgi:hypothetical protein